MKTNITVAQFLVVRCFGYWNDGTDVQMGRTDGNNPQSSRKESAFEWTDVYEKESNLSSALGKSRILESHGSLKCFCGCMDELGICFSCTLPHPGNFYLQKVQRIEPQLKRPLIRTSMKMQTLRRLVLANTSTGSPFSVRKHWKYLPRRHTHYVVLFEEDI